MKIYLSYRERVAGLFLVAAGLLVVLFVVGAAVQNRWFEPRVTFHTHVLRGDGLRTGSPVLLSGIEIGEIGDLTIMDDNRIDVEIVVREEHAHRIRTGSKAVVRRLLGIGEKRIHLASSDEQGATLPAGALLPADEPMDVLDAVASIDLGQYLQTMDRAVAAMEIMLTKLEEEGRMTRMIEAFDAMGPSMEQMNMLLTEINEPFAELIKDPALRRTFVGADKLFNDPATRRAMRHVSSTFEPERVSRLMDRTDRVIARLDSLLAEGGHAEGALVGMDRLMNDGRVDRMITNMERLTDAEKLEKLVDNMSVLADEMAKIGPEIPTIADELIVTMREMVIVFKALQEHWLLDDEAEEVREEMEKERREKAKAPAGP